MTVDVIYQTERTKVLTTSLKTMNFNVVKDKELIRQKNSKRLKESQELVVTPQKY